MLYPVLITASGAFAVALALTVALFRTAPSRGLLDIPNERSSHATPIPRGGGAAIVVAATAAFALLAVFHLLDPSLGIVLLGGGLAVATVGFIDDRRPLSARTRLVVHVGAAVWALFWLGPPHLPFAGETVRYALAVLGMVWVLNLYNFMDGIDGIAASEVIFVSWAGAFLLLLTDGSAQVSAAAVVFGAACGGFLLWNWPPAKIFMGDVGSGYLGYVIGVLALASSREHPAHVWVWLILGGVFFVDATVTLVRRICRGERVYQAHRIHAYQWLARRWGSHLRVTLTVLAVNFVWLLPCAFLAASDPTKAVWIAFMALTPMVAAVIAAGAGRPESS